MRLCDLLDLLDLDLIPLQLSTRHLHPYLWSQSIFIPLNLMTLVYFVNTKPSHPLIPKSPKLWEISVMLPRIPYQPTLLLLGHHSVYMVLALPTIPCCLIPMIKVYSGFIPSSILRFAGS